MVLVWFLTAIRDITADEEILVSFGNSVARKGQALSSRNRSSSSSSGCVRGRGRSLLLHVLNANVEHMQTLEATQTAPLEMNSALQPWPAAQRRRTEPADQFRSGRHLPRFPCPSLVTVSLLQQKLSSKLQRSKLHQKLQ